MREPVAREGSGPDAIGEAARRLDRALTRLEKQVAVRDPGAGSDLFEHDRSALAAELDAARARERALEDAAAAASAALGRAADEVRRALGEDEDEPIDDRDAALEDEGAGWEAPPDPDVEAGEAERKAAGAEATGDAGEAEAGGEAAAGPEPAKPDPRKDPAP